jgi:hypothetical protein
MTHSSWSIYIDLSFQICTWDSLSKHCPLSRLSATPNYTIKSRTSLELEIAPNAIKRHVHQPIFFPSIYGPSSRISIPPAWTILNRTGFGLLVSIKLRRITVGFVEFWEICNEEITGRQNRKSGTNLYRGLLVGNVSAAGFDGHADASKVQCETWKNLAARFTAAPFYLDA